MNRKRSLIDLRDRDQPENVTRNGFGLFMVDYYLRSSWEYLNQVLSCD